MLITKVYLQGALFPEAIVKNGKLKGWGTFHSYKSYVKYPCNCVRYCKIFSQENFI